MDYNLFAFMAFIKTVRHAGLLLATALLSLRPAIKPFRTNFLETFRKPVKEFGGFCFASIFTHLLRFNGNLLTYQTEVGCLVSCVMAAGFVSSSGPFSHKIFVMEETSDLVFGCVVWDTRGLVWVLASRQAVIWHL